MDDCMRQLVLGHGWLLEELFPDCAESEPVDSCSMVILFHSNMSQSYGPRSSPAVIDCAPWILMPAFGNLKHNANK